MKCCECNDDYDYFMYEYEGKYYCEECIGQKLFNIDNLIRYIDSDEDLQDEIYIERGFGCELRKSSPLLREYCRKAIIDDWANGSDDWKELYRLSMDKEYLEMFGAKHV